MAGSDPSRSDPVVRLDERLAEPGQALPLAGTLACAGFRAGDRDFSAPDGIAYDLLLTNTGEAILATGSARARLLGECDRCLGPAELDLEGQAEALFAPEGSEFEADDGDDGVETYPIRDESLDLTEPVRSAVAVEIPFKVLCREDCKGLCPVCGQNLNEGDCGCAERLAQEPDPMNPFSVLKDFEVRDDES